MREVKQGDVIGSVECPGCGNHTPLKINSKGNVYFFCAKRIGINPLTGKQEACLTRMNWGRTASKKVIEQFLAAEKENEHAEPENREEQPTEPSGTDTGADTSAGSPEPAAIVAGGIGDAVRKFFS